MTSLELDHIFCFCSPELPEVAIAEAGGFRLNAGTRHENQGTANRSIFFEKNYLELIYLASREEAEHNPLNIHRRADWKSTGASPFGIALRGTLSDQEKLNFWGYRPSYLPSGVILIHKENGDELPLIFVVPPRDGANSAMYPSQWPNLDKSLLDHPAGAKNIISVKVRGPGYVWPLPPVANVIFDNANAPGMEVVVDGKLRKNLSLNNLVSIVSN